MFVPRANPPLHSSRMTAPAKIAVTSALALFLAGLGTVDAYLTEDVLPAAVIEAPTLGAKPSAQPVAKAEGPDVLKSMVELGFTLEVEKQTSLLEQVVPAGTPLQYRTLLLENDRAGYVIWADSPSVKTYFTALKEALLGSFSGQVTDLRDETSHESGRPVVNTLTFLDPTISEDRILFVRVQERLYELHLVRGKEELLQPLIDVLTRK